VIVQPENRLNSPNYLLPPQMHNKQLVLLKNTVQNERYMSGIFEKYENKR
jgi:hypothetical protein